MVLQISINNLIKRFRGGFSLDVENLIFKGGSIYCLFGVNGSGKSTLFKIMTGEEEPDNGSVLYCNNKITPSNYRLKRIIGYLPQDSNLPKWATARDLLSYASSLYEAQKADSLIEEQLIEWDCLDYGYRPMNNCSHGMQKRLGLALASFHNPDYLILDEPFSGLDPRHLLALQQLLRKRLQQGKLTILSTHIIPYAAEFCDKAYIMSEGGVTSLSEWQQLPELERIKKVKQYFTKA